MLLAIGCAAQPRHSTIPTMSTSVWSFQSCVLELREASTDDVPESVVSNMMGIDTTPPGTVQYDMWHLVLIVQTTGVSFRTFIDPSPPQGVPPGECFAVIGQCQKYQRVIGQLLWDARSCRIEHRTQYITGPLI